MRKIRKSCLFVVDYIDLGCIQKNLSTFGSSMFSVAWRSARHFQGWCCVFTMTLQAGIRPGLGKSQPDNLQQKELTHTATMATVVKTGVPMDPQNWWLLNIVSIKHFAHWHFDCLWSIPNMSNNELIVCVTEPCKKICHKPNQPVRKLQQPSSDSEVSGSTPTRQRQQHLDLWQKCPMLQRSAKCGSWEPVDIFDMLNVFVHKRLLIVLSSERNMRHAWLVSFDSCEGTLGQHGCKMRDKNHEQ